MNLAWASAILFSHNGKLLIRNATQASNRSPLDFLKAKAKALNKIKNSNDLKLVP